MQNHQIMVPSQFAAEAESIACHIAGGCMTIPGARSLWYSNRERRIIADDITLLIVFESGTKARNAIVDMLFRNGEQAVCYVTNGVPALVDAPLPPAESAALQAELQEAA